MGKRERRDGTDRRSTRPIIGKDPLEFELMSTGPNAAAKERAVPGPKKGYLRIDYRATRASSDPSLVDTMRKQTCIH